jgi:hypothetical protein
LIHDPKETDFDRFLSAIDDGRAGGRTEHKVGDKTAEDVFADPHMVTLVKAVRSDS